MEAEKQKIERDTVTTTTIVEGQAEVCVKLNNVFYNPVQEFNRDLSIAVLSIFVADFKIQQFDKYKNKKKAKADNTLENGNQLTCSDEVPVVILEALAATGLRSIRYAKEVPKVTKIIANDLVKEAVETLKENILYNGVGDMVEASNEDASMLMHKYKSYTKRFTAIDLDPFGSPATFLDAAVQSVQDGGLLMVTATDMAVLAGVTPEKCYSKYGAISLKTKSCHEMAIRILIKSIEDHANRYTRYVVPLLSVSVDFYVRVFVQVFTGALQCKRTTSKLSMVYHCVGCDTTTLQPLGGFRAEPGVEDPARHKPFLPTGPPVGALCEHCNQKHHLGGPVWSAPIHDQTFVAKVLRYVGDAQERFGTAKRLVGMLSMVREELPDVPLYYSHAKLFGVAHLETMPVMQFRSALLHAGYRVSYSHACKLSVKTDAPPRFVWDLVRAWEKQRPVNKAKMESDPVTRYLLSQEIQSEVNFEERDDANPDSRQNCVRFQMLPANWGPGCKGAVNVRKKQEDKSFRNQNKNKYRRDKKRHYDKKKRRLSRASGGVPKKKFAVDSERKMDEPDRLQEDIQTEPSVELDKEIDANIDTK